MFTENLDVFLQDFGVTVTAGGQTFLGLLDQPGEMLGLGSIDAVSIAYVLTVKSHDASNAGLRGGVQLVADGRTYTVKERLPDDDGAFCRLTLRK